MPVTETEHLLRPRRDEDLPALTRVLAAQQPHSGYPYVWPRPAPVAEFVVRAGELRAWTAELDGRPVGHLSLTRVDAADPAGPLWAEVAGRPVADLVCVSALFVDHELWSRGIGTDLLREARTWARDHGRVCCLDVVPEHARALQVYRRAGWREAGTLQPGWLDPQDGPQLLLVEPATA